MVNYDYPDLFLSDAVTKNFVITDGTLVVTESSYTTVGATVNIINSILEEESFELVQRLNTSMQLEFGSCESASITFTFRDNAESYLVGKKLKVYIIPNNEPLKYIQLGEFKVVKDQRTNNRKSRQITAYDAMYDILNADVAEWYNDILPDKNASITLTDFAIDFLGHFGILAEPFSLVNGSVEIHRTKNPEVLSGGEVIKAICQLSGTFGKITNEGMFRFVALPINIHTSPETTEILPAYYSDCDYSDVDSRSINGIRIITDVDSADVGTEETEEDYNHYIISNNFLISDYDNNSALYAPFGKLSLMILSLSVNVYGRTYTPCTVNAIGNPVHEVGDPIKVVGENGVEVYSIILERRLKGIQALRDTYTANGEEFADASLNSSLSRYDQLSRSVSNVNTEVEELDFPEIIRNIGFRLLAEPSSVSVVYDSDSDSVKIMWSDPPDISTNQPVPCTWAGTIVVRKEGSPPKNRWDGEVLVDSTTRDEYASEPFVDNTFEHNMRYYYGIFPYHNAGGGIKHYRYTKTVAVKIGKSDLDYMLISSFQTVDHGNGDVQSRSDEYHYYGKVSSTNSYTTTNQYHGLEVTKFAYSMSNVSRTDYYTNWNGATGSNTYGWLSTTESAVELSPMVSTTTSYKNGAAVSVSETSYTIPHEPPEFETYRTAVMSRYTSSVTTEQHESYHLKDLPVNTLTQQTTCLSYEFVNNLSYTSYNTAGVPTSTFTISTTMLGAGAIQDSSSYTNTSTTYDAGNRVTYTYTQHDYTLSHATTTTINSNSQGGTQSASRSFATMTYNFTLRDNATTNASKSTQIYNNSVSDNATTMEWLYTTVGTLGYVGTAANRGIYKNTYVPVM